MKEKAKALFANTNSILVFLLFAIGIAYTFITGNDPFVFPSTKNPINYAYMMVIAFAQNVSFSMVSRARNRDSVMYHMIAAWCSNGVWFATFAYLVYFKLNWMLFVPYTCGTVAGSLTGTQISIWIECILGATSDSHVVKKVPTHLEIMDRVHARVYAIEVVSGLVKATPLDEIEFSKQFQGKNLKTT